MLVRSGWWVLLITLCLGLPCYGQQEHQRYVFGGEEGTSLSSLEFLEKEKIFFFFFPFIFYLKVLLVNGGQNLISDSVTPPCASDFSWHCTDYPCTKSPLWLTRQRAWSIFCLSENDISFLPPSFFFFFYHLNTGLKTTVRKGPMWSRERHSASAYIPKLKHQCA